jgi:hypothetical protein
MTDPSTGMGETRAETDSEPRSSKYWLAEIEAAKKRQQAWHKRARGVLERYRDERDEANKNQRKVNILWANTEVLKSALFAQLGNPDVRRAFPKPGRSNKIARTAALLLERSLTACANFYDAEHEIECAVEDMLLPGRGQCWLEYEVDLAEDDTIRYQSAKFAYVAWDRFLHGSGNRFSDWPWVSRLHLWTRDELVEKFPEHGKDIPLGYVLPDCDKNDEGDELFRRAAVHEVWDKTKKERLYIAETYPQVIKADADPFKLRDFFPCPRPLDAVKTTNDPMPIPEYCEYQDQAAELDRITTRINKLTELMKFAGLYDDSMPDVEKLLDVGYLSDGQFEPLKGAAAWREAGGIAAALFFIPLDQIVPALQQLYQQRSVCIQTIYEVTGISDLVRGFSEGSKTATEQSLKAKFGSQRMQKRQKEVQRFVRDLYKLKGELIAEHFERKQLSDMSGILLPTAEEKAQAQQIMALVQMHEQMKQQPPAPMGHNGGPPMDDMAQGQPPMPPQGAPQPQGMAA